MDIERNKARNNEFKCEMCKETYEIEWTDEEARNEAEGHGMIIEQCGIVCDDCYKLTPWGAA